MTFHRQISSSERNYDGNMNILLSLDSNPIVRHEEACRRAKNLIRSFRKDELIIKASSILKVCEKNTSEWSRWNPYSLLLIIRWAFIYAEQNSIINPVTDTQLLKLSCICNEICGNAKFLTGESANINKFLRTMSFQQFWLQSSIFTGIIARLNFLFCTSDSDIQDNFKRNAGLTATEYLELSFIVWGFQTKPNDPLVPNEYFKTTFYPSDVVSNYFKLSGKTIPEMSEYLGSKKGVRNFYLQAAERSPLIKYPLLILPNGVFKYSQCVFEAHMKTIFYEVLKSTGGSPLAEKFAVVFENYIAKLLNCSNQAFLKEADIKKIVGKSSKVTDFAIPFENTTVLIEVKSIEMKPLSQVNPDDEVMIRELKDSVIKAVIQAYELIHNLKNTPSPDIKCCNHFSLFIITYSDLYLGAPLRLWNEFLKDAVTKNIKTGRIDEDALSPERIFVISTDEIESIVEKIGSGVFTFPDFIERAVNNNRNPMTTKLLMHMHITNEEKAKSKEVDFFKVEFEAFYNRIFDKIIK